MDITKLEALLIGLFKTVGDLHGDKMVIFGFKNLLEMVSVVSTLGLLIPLLEK